jgi:glutathione S-transferase
MKLFFKPTSPYARKVLIVAREAGLMDRIQTLDVPLRDPNSDFWKSNPTGMIPALLTDDGELVVESNYICDYLDSLNKGTRLIPVDLGARLRAYKLSAFAGLIMDAFVTRRRESLRPAEVQDTKKIELEKERISSILNALEEEPKLLDGPLNIGHITLGCALSVGERHFPKEDWRPTRPGIAKWYADFKQRPFMKETYAE